MGCLVLPDGFKSRIEIRPVIGFLGRYQQLAGQCSVQTRLGRREFGGKIDKMLPSYVIVADIIATIDILNTYFSIMLSMRIKFIFTPFRITDQTCL